jgi:hypothetical protein
VWLVLDCAIDTCHQEKNTYKVHVPWKIYLKKGMKRKKNIKKTAPDGFHDMHYEVDGASGTHTSRPCHAAWRL